MTTKNTAFLLLALLDVGLGCGGGDSGGTPADAGQSDSSPVDAATIDAGSVAPALEFVSRILFGTNADWCGDDLVYQKRRFDANFPFRSDVYTTRPFDQNPQEVCLTCAVPALADVQFKGDPDWHPSCDFVLFTASNQFATGLIEEDPSFAINSDLWVIDRDGAEASAHVVVPHLVQGRAALHPHFDPSGNFIVWTDRVEPSDNTYCEGGRPTPGCTNPWGGWLLSIGMLSRDDNVFSLDGAPILFADGQPDEDLRGMYEPGEVYATGDTLNVYYSRTRCGLNGDPATTCGYEFMGDDMEIPFDTVNLTFGNPIKVSGIDGEWSEKLQRVGDGRHLSVSSSAHSAWNFFDPGSTFANLSLEVHTINIESTEQSRITRFSDPSELAAFATEMNYDSCSTALASDHAWSNDGRNFATNATYLCIDGALRPSPPTLVIFRNLNSP